MSYRKRLKDLEERLSVDKEELQPLVVIIDRGEEKGKPCHLETEERSKCPVYREKGKEVLAKKPGEIKPLPMVFLDCQEKCPHTPTGEGGQTK